MSEAVSALNAAVWSSGDAKVQDAGLRGMVAVRADLSDKALAKAVKSAVGVSVPDVRGLATGESGAVAWMSPDELLILCDYDAVQSTIGTMTKALGKSHALVADVSDARALFHVTAPNAREIIAKLAPVDMSPGAFDPGMVRRTRLAQSAAAIWIDEDGCVSVICFRSVARYVFDLLCTAADPDATVDYY